MYRVLGRDTSGNVQKVLFFLEETRTAYEREDYGRQFGNTATADYLGLNPAGKVPTLVDGDAVIWESNTILRYLAAKEAPTLAGSNPAEKADVERWMDFLLAAVNPGYMAAFRGSKQTPEERPDSYDADIADLIAQLSIVDGRLQGRDWLALDRLSIADIACGPVLRRCLAFDTGRPALAGLEAWMARLQARPAFAKIAK